MMTLALLLTAVTGAWADETLLLTIESKDYESFYRWSKTFDDKVTVTFSNEVYNAGDEWGWYTIVDNSSLLTVAGINGYTITSCKFYTDKGIANTGYTVEGESPSVYLSDLAVFPDDSKSVNIGSYGIMKIEVYGGVASSATPVPLTWDATAKTATLTNGMPAGNVTVSVEYFPQATMADGAVTAATDVKATTEDALVTIDKSKLTGVAKLMYYVSTDAEATAPAYNAEGWTDQVPTAANYTEAGTVNVWYYAVGADSDDPAETYSDGDICATALTVTLGAAPKYNAEFDLTNAPEADKAPGVWKTDITGEGVKKGTPVTVTYTGTKKVLGVKAEKKATKLTITIPATENAAALTLDVTGCTTWEQILDQNVTTLDYEGDGVYGQTSNCYILDGNNNRLNLNTPYDPTTNYHWGTQR